MPDWWAARREREIAALTTGMEPRDRLRLDMMLKPDEPLPQEVFGLQVFAAFSCGLLTHLLLHDAFLGALIGCTFGPVFATLPTGKRGDLLRKLGWSCWMQTEAVGARITAVFARLVFAAETHGLSDQLKVTAAKVSRLDRKLGVSERAMLTARMVGARAQRFRILFLEWLERRGLSRRLRKLWSQTGIPQAIARSRAAFESQIVQVSDACQQLSL